MAKKLKRRKQLKKYIKIIKQNVQTLSERVPRYNDEQIINYLSWIEHYLKIYKRLINGKKIK